MAGLIKGKAAIIDTHKSADNIKVTSFFIAETILSFTDYLKDNLNYTVSPCRFM